MKPKIYAFERIDASLDLIPLAARRALDVAGRKISLEAWRAAPIEARRELVALGSADHVNKKKVHDHLREADVPHARVEPIEEPSSTEAPPELADAELTASAWTALRPLDRWALVKIARGRHPEGLSRALAEITPPLSTHLDAHGHARMVDVGGKDATVRRAVARARVTMTKQTLDRLRAGDTPKGDVLAVARVAGIQAAKRTPDLIPLCHAIALTRAAVDLRVDEDAVRVVATCEAHDRTGVEMEAMTAASVAALTLYDMLKGIDRSIRFEVELAEKTGGKSGDFRREREGERRDGEEA